MRGALGHPGLVAQVPGSQEDRVVLVAGVHNDQGGYLGTTAATHYPVDYVAPYLVLVRTNGTGKQGIVKKVSPFFLEIRAIAPAGPSCHRSDRALSRIGSRRARNNTLVSIKDKALTVLRMKNQALALSYSFNRIWASGEERRRVLFVVGVVRPAISAYRAALSSMFRFFLFSFRNI